ncbi:MAG: hypothetical protein R3C99_03345 [Pirellulaceae bacterium]
MEKRGSALEAAQQLVGRYVSSSDAFIRNKATGTSDYFGSGSLYNDATLASFVDCWFVGNSSAGYGGGIVAKWETQTYWYNCSVLDNFAKVGGESIHRYDGGHPFDSASWRGIGLSRCSSAVVVNPPRFSDLAEIG